MTFNKSFFIIIFKTKFIFYTEKWHEYRTKKNLVLESKTLLIPNAFYSCISKYLLIFFNNHQIKDNIIYTPGVSPIKDLNDDIANILIMLNNLEKRVHKLEQRLEYENDANKK